jgi:hypothetical protein
VPSKVWGWRGADSGVGVEHAGRTSRATIARRMLNRRGREERGENITTSTIGQKKTGGGRIVRIGLQGQWIQEEMNL